MAVAKALGASRVIAVDIVPSRLEFARGYAATDCYQPPPLEAGEPNVEYSRRNATKMKKELSIDDRGSRSIDLVIDARLLFRSSYYISTDDDLFPKRRGSFHSDCNSCSQSRRNLRPSLWLNVAHLPSHIDTFSKVGMGNSNIMLNVGMLIVKEVTYKGSFRYGVCPNPPSEFYWSNEFGSAWRLSDGDFPGVTG